MAVFLFFLSVFAVALPVWVAQKHKPPHLAWADVGLAMLAAGLYVLSLLGYACWAVATSLHWRDRRFATSAVLLIFLATNFLVWIYHADPLSFMNVQSLAHPTLIAVSPVGATYHWLQASADPLWGAVWKDPKFDFVLPFAYQVLFLLSGLVAMKWESQNLPKEYAEEPGPVEVDRAPDASVGEQV